jgi:hypothetical protein
MSGRDHYITEAQSISKSSRRIRIVLAICVVIVAIVLIAAAIALMVVFIPKNPNIVLGPRSDVYFNLNYCPSPVNTACCSGSTCSFVYSNLYFAQNVSVAIQNNNYIAMSYDSVTLTVTYGNIVLAVQKVPGGSLPASQTTNVCCG